MLTEHQLRAIETTVKDGRFDLDHEDLLELIEEVRTLSIEADGMQAELRRLKSAGDLLAAAVLEHDPGPLRVDPRVAAHAWAAARSTRPQGDSDE